MVEMLHLGVVVVVSLGGRGRQRGGSQWVGTHTWKAHEEGQPTHALKRRGISCLLSPCPHVQPLPACSKRVIQSARQNGEVWSPTCSTACMSKLLARSTTTHGSAGVGRWRTPWTCTRAAGKGKGRDIYAWSCISSCRHMQAQGQGSAGVGWQQYTALQ